MNAQRAERTVQIVSIAGIWVAFLLGWLFKNGLASAWSERRGDLPSATLLYLEWADSWLALAFPAICTMLIVWLIRLRSVHLNWVASSVLMVGVLYGIFAQFAFILPTFNLCGDCGAFSNCRP